MNIIKRSGMEVVFNAIKIEDAVRKANKSVTIQRPANSLN